MGARGKGQHGFTLMEMMAVIAIIGIILAIALPAYSSWRERAAVRSAADALMAHLKQARHLAIAENRSVTLVFSPASYVFDAVPAGVPLNDKTPYRNQTIPLSKRFGVTLGFTYAGGKLTFTSSGTATSGSLTLTAGATTRTITINGIGRAYQ